MEEKQKKQLEIIRKVLSDEKNISARSCLLNAHGELHNCAKRLTSTLNVLDVISGHSELVMAASAIVGLSQQIEMILFREADVVDASL